MEWLIFMKIHGMTITLYNKVVTGQDGFGEDIVEEQAVNIENVIVSPVNSDEVVNTLNLTGRKAVYTLGIPKGDMHDWEDKKVEFFGDTFRTFGAVTQGIEDMIPLKWNKKVMCERYE